MKILFAGTPEVAVPALEALAREHEVIAVLTRPDAPIGRKRILTPSPVALASERLGIPIIKSSRIDDEAALRIADTGAELGVVVAYGALIPDSTLHALSRGWINLHFSKLPELRGAAPLQRAIIAGAQQAHLTVFHLVTELDAGAIIDVVSEPLNDDETAGHAFERLAEIGAQQLCRVVDAIDSGEATAIAQSGMATYAHKLSVADGQLTPAMMHRDALNRFRGVTPEPGAWIESSTGRVKLLACAVSDTTNSPAPAEFTKPGSVSFHNGSVHLGFSDGELNVTQVQPAGKQAMSASDWFRGIHSPKDWRFE